MLYPLKLRPKYVEKVWGGNRIFSFLDKRPNGMSNIGESWGLYCNQDEGSVIDNGNLKGMSLSDVTKRYSKELTGANIDYPGNFPLMFKFIDANDILSVQVHPDKNFANRVEGSNTGKTEAWYILDADEGAELILGWNRSFTSEEILDAISNNVLEKYLYKYPVKKGDVFFIPPGTVHAIGKGILLAEVQQNCNITYRLYDWGRVGLDGNPRQLHIDKALQALNLNVYNKEKEEALLVGSGYAMRLLVCSSYFTMELVDVYEMFLQWNNHSMICYSVLIGEGQVVYGDNEFVPICKGDTFIIPSSLEGYRIEGDCQLIRYYVSGDVQSVRACYKVVI